MNDLFCFPSPRKSLKLLREELNWIVYVNIQGAWKILPESLYGFFKFFAEESKRRRHKCTVGTVTCDSSIIILANMYILTNWKIFSEHPDLECEQHACM